MANWLQKYSEGMSGAKNCRTGARWTVIFLCLDHSWNLRGTILCWAGITESEIQPWNEGSWLFFPASAFATNKAVCMTIQRRLAKVGLWTLNHLRLWDEAEWSLKGFAWGTWMQALALSWGLKSWSGPEPRSFSLLKGEVAPLKQMITESSAGNK